MQHKYGEDPASPYPQDPNVSEPALDEARSTD